MSFSPGWVNISGAPGNRATYSISSYVVSHLLASKNVAGSPGVECGARSIINAHTTHDSAVLRYDSLKPRIRNVILRTAIHAVVGVQ